VETRLQLTPGEEPPQEPLPDGERSRLLEIIQPLTLPELSFEQRLEITSRIRALLTGAIEVKDEAWIPPPVMALQEI
jgi:hypothetical protein